jgi:hypothetical protein
MDPVRRIAEAVLYEGYLLWPYRRSAFKNRRRWTLGGVYPRAYCGRGEGDRWTTRTECLVEAGDGPATVSVDVRFLQIVRREVVRCGPGGQEPVDELTVAGRRHLAWEEATERELSARGLDLTALGDAAAEVAIEISPGRETEWLEDPPGHRAGAVVRSRRALRGAVAVRSRRAADGVHVLTVELRNTTPGDWTGREEVLPHIFASAHVVARVSGGGFVSLTDPPPRLRPLAGACRNAGLWPVLAGAEGARDTILSAPIILPDHPQIAPESPGDLFDATEIDQLLTLNVLALTDQERAEMRDSDPRAREILERIEAMSPGQLMRLHGAVREFRPLKR